MLNKVDNPGLKGIIVVSAKMENETGLLIGSGGGKLEIGEMDIEPMFTYFKYNGKTHEVPLIPGSSIKGVLRSTCERIIKSIKS